MIVSNVFSESRVSGATLILGSVVMLAGAVTFGLVKDANGPMIFGQPPREWLRLINAHEGTWRLSTILFIVGSLTTLAGWDLLAGRLERAGGSGFARVGLLALAIGVTVFLVWMTVRLSAEIWAAKSAVATQSVPDLFAPLAAWNGALFALYTVLTFVGLALFGAAMLTTSALPNWLGVSAIVYGLAGLAVFAVARDMPPFVHYLPTPLIGVLLLRG
ncbi:MAG TPA: hypothetical protein VID73_08640 [Ktedonobacterales bacterium]|jgi:hypothetical protein